jgi:hypothetical protein
LKRTIVWILTALAVLTLVSAVAFADPRPPGGGDYTPTSSQPQG